VTHQNVLPDVDVGSTVSSTPDTDPKTSASISLPVESQVVDMVETSGVIKENEGIELKSTHNHIADDSDVGHDAKAVGSMTTAHRIVAKMLLGMANYIEEQWPSQVSAHESF
jgi:hypothetical protein